MQMFESLLLVHISGQLTCAFDTIIALSMHQFDTGLWVTIWTYYCHVLRVELLSMLECQLVYSKMVMLANQSFFAYFNMFNHHWDCHLVHTMEWTRWPTKGHWLRGIVEACWDYFLEPALSCQLLHITSDVYIHNLLSRWMQITSDSGQPKNHAALICECAGPIRKRHVSPWSWL